MRVCMCVYVYVWKVTDAEKTSTQIVFPSTLNFNVLP